MTYTEWRDELKNNLLSVSESERKRVLEYYAEAYADRREAGFSEKEIIADFGAPYDAAQRILCEEEPTQRERREGQPAAQKRSEVTKSAEPKNNQVQRAEEKKTEDKKKISKASWIVPLCIGAVILMIAISFLIMFSVSRRLVIRDLEMEQYTAQGEITELAIKNSAGSVRTEYYDGDKVVVDYPVSEWFKMTIEEKDDGTLFISGLKNKHWYTFMSVSSIPATVVKIPQGCVLKLDITVNAGSVSLAQGQFDTVNVTVNAGSLSSLGITCTEFTSKLNAGAIAFASLKSTSLDCKVSAGSFDVDSLTCPLVNISVSAGAVGVNMKGSKEDYTILVDKSAGSCNVKSQTGTDPEKKIDIHISAGSVSVSFI